MYLSALAIRIYNCRLVWAYAIYSGALTRCAEETAAGGYKYFGILNYAECWVEGRPNFHNKMAPKGKCHGPRPESYLSCDKKSLGPCVGIPDYQYVYGVEQGGFICF